MKTEWAILKKKNLTKERNERNEGKRRGNEGNEGKRRGNEDKQKWLNCVCLLWRVSTVTVVVVMSDRHRIERRNSPQSQTSSHRPTIYWPCRPWGHDLTRPPSKSGFSNFANEPPSNIRSAPPLFLSKRPPFLFHDCSQSRLLSVLSYHASLNGFSSRQYSSFFCFSRNLSPVRIITTIL